MGLLGPSLAGATTPKGVNDTQTILNIAATAEVLATIVNTVGAERAPLGDDPVTLRNIRAAAREELIHYDELVKLGAKPLATKIWVPTEALKTRNGLLNTLEVGDQIFVYAYLIATKTFGAAGKGDLALVAAEFMGVEAVHRALARQSLGKLGNDRVFMKFDGKETADALNKGTPGFSDITVAAVQLQGAGFGFGVKGSKPGQFFTFENVRKRTPTDPALNTFAPDV